MNVRLITGLYLLIFIGSVSLFVSEAQSEQGRSAFSLRWENDTFGGTDANYTNGMSAALTRPGSGLLGGIWNLLGAGNGRKTSTYEITQLQFTPSDLTLNPPDPNDRPYVGLTYLASATHLQREESLQSFKLIAGFVGPDSGADAAQRLAHHALNQKSPQGWAYQLRDEGVFNLQYEYRHKYQFKSRTSGLGIELIPMAGGFLGNYLTQAQSDVLIRFGYHLADDFGPTSLRGIGYLPLPQFENTDYSWGTDAFIRGGANLVIHNMTLDGNTFMKSRSVNKHLVVPAVEFGIELWTKYFLTTASFQYRGREFDAQQNREGYGSILVSLLF